MPHITEEIWHTVTQASDDQYLALQSYPEVDATLINPDLESQFDLLIGVIRTIRNLRAEAEIKPSTKIRVILQSQSDRERQILQAGQSYIQDLTKVEEFTLVEQLPESNEQAIAGVTGTVQVLVPLAGVVDVASLCAKVERDLKKIDAEIQSLSGRLNNPNFVARAAAEVVQTARDALAEAETQKGVLSERLAQLRSLG